MIKILFIFFIAPIESSLAGDNFRPVYPEDALFPWNEWKAVTPIILKNPETCNHRKD